MGRKYSDEVKQFISDNVEGRTTKELVKLVNEKFNLDFTVSKMRAFKTNHGLRSNTLRGVPAGQPTDLYPKDVLDFIFNNYKGTGPKNMAELLNEKFGTRYTHGQLKAFYSNRKLNSGVTGQFKKGHIPHNKGKKGGGWKPTQFKKGHVPHNYKPVGSERVNSEGYIDVKIADPNRWKAKHVLIWEKHHGRKKPDGHAIIFADGNNRNFDINNLILVTRRELLLLNRQGLIKKDTDLTKAAVNLVKLQIEIKDKEDA